MFEFVWKSCLHDKITPNMMAGYCPDCGEYVENHWYITRCKCCGIKQQAIFRKGKLVTLANFCRNCGCNSFKSEKLEKIDIVNINYAVVMKQTSKITRKSVIQTWIDQNSYAPLKLLPSY